MKQPNKKFIVSLVVLGIALFWLSPVFANGLVDVVFQTGTDPLFEESNFLPGQEITQWVEVTNKSNKSLPIGTEITNLACSGSDDYCLADKLNLIIEDKDSNKLYENSLTDFFNNGEQEIADLAVDATEKYYFSITFLPESGDDYQGLEVSFDFKIGSLGTESIGGEIITGGSGNGGGYFITGLEIYDEKASELEENQATIDWLTNKPATSRVVYSSKFEPHNLELDNLPDYGYAHSTIEDVAKVTKHSVTIFGLESETIYYFRCISRGSFAVSVEHSFTTPGIMITEEEEESRDEPVYSEVPTDNQPVGEEPVVAGVSIEKEEDESGISFTSFTEIQEETEEDKEISGRFSAAIGGLFGLIDLCLVLFILIIILIILSLLSIKEKNKDEKKKKKWWILNFIIAILLILYYFLCPFLWYRWLIILGLIALIVLLPLFKNRKKREK